MSKKIRLDIYLAKNQFSESQEKAKKEIISGWIKINGETVRDPLKLILGNESITVRRPGGIFISRGGEKLNFALEQFQISLKDNIAVDLGASTGGFTDCMLKAGAKKVYSVDVGYGQLDYQLRNDDRVVVMERTNVRNLSKENFNESIDFVTADLSFISILKVFDKIKLLFSSAEGVILLKPQFEAESNEHIKGVVIKKENHIAILNRVIELLINKGMNLKELTYSPIKGPAGNIEFLIYFNNEKREEGNCNKDEIIELVNDVVKKAHLILN